MRIETLVADPYGNGAGRIRSALEPRTADPQFSLVFSG